MPDLTIPTPGQIRVGDVERERVAAQLAEHHVAGRLTMSELDDRLTLTLASRTRDDLGATLVDLPPVAPARAAPTVAPRRTASAPAQMAWRGHLITYLVVIAGLWLIWLLTGAGYPWPIWPMLGWGLSVFAHHSGVSLCGRVRAPARG